MEMLQKLILRDSFAACMNLFRWKIWRSNSVFMKKYIISVFALLAVCSVEMSAQNLLNRIGKAIEKEVEKEVGKEVQKRINQFKKDNPEAGKAYRKEKTGNSDTYSRALQVHIP